MVDQAPEQQLQGHCQARLWGVFTKYLPPTPEGEKSREPTHPVPTPALLLSLEHVVARLGAFQAAAGTHYHAGACTTRSGVPNQEEAALPGAEQPAASASFISALSSNPDRVL